MNQYDADDLKLEQEFKGTGDAAPKATTDSDVYEVETNEILDRLYHKWLGEKVEGGVWTRDKFKVRLMNEKGASLFITTMEHLFNKNSQFGVIKEEEKRQLIGDICMELEPILTYDHWKYDVNPRYNMLILNMIEKALRIWLTINEEGSMIQYKSGKNKTIINKHETPSNGGAF